MFGFHQHEERKISCICSRNLLLELDLLGKQRRGKEHTTPESNLYSCTNGGKQNQRRPELELLFIACLRPAGKREKRWTSSLPTWLAVVPDQPTLLAASISLGTTKQKGLSNEAVSPPARSTTGTSVRLGLGLIVLPLTQLSVDQFARLPGQLGFMTTVYYMNQKLFVS